MTTQENYTKTTTVSRATTLGMAAFTGAPSLAVLTAFADPPAAATSGKKLTSPFSHGNASTTLHTDVGVTSLATTALSSPTRIHCVITQTAQKHIFPLLASIHDLDEGAAETFPVQWGLAGGHNAATAGTLAASGFAPSVGDHAQETTSPARLNHNYFSPQPDSCLQRESAAAHRSSQTPVLLSCASRPELLAWAQLPNCRCCGFEHQKFVHRTARACRPVKPTTRLNLSSIYLKRLQVFHSRMEARYGGSHGKSVVPYHTSHPRLSNASKATSISKGHDVEPSTARPSDCNKRSRNNTSTRGISSATRRLVYTENADGACPDSQKPFYTQKGEARALAAGAIRRIAGRSLRRGWEKGGWVGWARALTPSSSSPTLSTSRSSSLNRHGEVFGTGQNNIFPSTPCVCQKKLPTARLTAGDEATRVKVACSTLSTRCLATRSRAAEKQDSQRKSEQHPEQEAVALEPVDHRRQREKSNTTNSDHPQRRRRADPSAEKQTPSKRRRAMQGNSGSKRVRFAGTLLAALTNGELGGPTISRAHSEIPVLGNQQEQQQCTNWSTRQSSSGRQTSDQTSRAVASRGLCAGEAMDTQADAGRTGKGVHIAGVDGTARSTVLRTARQTLTAAQGVRKSTSNQKGLLAQVPAVTAFSAGALSLRAPSGSRRVLHGASQASASPASVGTEADCENRQAFCPTEQSQPLSSVPVVCRVKALNQTGRERSSQTEYANVPTAARMNGSNGAVADVPQKNLLPNTAARFDATPSADDRLQQHGTTQQGPQDWQSTEQKHATQLWEQDEMQQWHQRQEHWVQQEDRLSTQRKIPQWHLENCQRLQQNLCTLRQRCREAELPDDQHYHQSRKQLTPISSQDPVRQQHAANAQQTEAQQREVQKSEACQLALSLSLQGGCMQRETHFKYRQYARLHGGHLSKGAGVGATSGKRRRTHATAAHSSDTLSNCCFESSTFSPGTCNQISTALVTVSSGEPQEPQLGTSLSCNSNSSTAKRSVQVVGTSSPCSRSTKSTCASAAAAAAAFNALPRARGVWFDAIRGLVRTGWKEGGRVRTAGFPVRKLGLAEARIQAVEHRLFRCPNDPLPSDLRAIVPRKNPEDYGWSK